jgi:hypothetical protein
MQSQCTPSSIYKKQLLLNHTYNKNGFSYITLTLLFITFFSSIVIYSFEILAYAQNTSWLRYDIFHIFLTFAKYKILREDMGVQAIRLLAWMSHEKTF